MLDLSNITLVCADTRDHRLALRALRICLAHGRFARALFLTDRPLKEDGIECVPIAPMRSAEDYSRLLVKELAPRIDTAHVLVVQWDGYITHPEAWSEEFLEYDYIGARWPWQPPGSDVGNGGFSLRSAKLLRALADPEVTEFPVEDIAIAQRYRPMLEARHGVRFAPAAVADRFSFEVAAPPAPSFGFHGLFNFWRVLADADLPAVLADLDDSHAQTPQLRVLGVNYLTIGRREPAAQVFRRLLATRPDDREVARLLEFALGRRSGPLAGRNDPCPCGSGRRFKGCHGAVSAASAQREVAAATPASGMPEASPDLASALRLHETGKVEAAERIYRQLLARNPNDPVPLHFLGVAAMQRRELATAIELLKRAVELLPAEANFHNNLGLALVEADQPEEAIASYERCLSLDPRNVGAWSNLGLARQAVLDVPGAIAAFETAVSLAPQFDRAHWNLAYAYLLCGRFAEGWREYEWRLKIKELGGGLPPLPGPEWNGAPVAGATLLLRAEQGLGDAIQFARFVPLILQRGMKVILECAPSLHGVLASIHPDLQLLARGSAPPKHDFHLPLLSLPGRFGITLNTVPQGVPYVRAPGDQVRQWRERLRELGPGINIGISWGGSRDNPYDRYRSCPLREWTKLATVPGVRLISLQVGERRDELQELPESSRPLDWGADFVTTAAQIDALDLVIAVDSAIAHLAGALGRPVWVLLPYSPDWRWLTDRSDSPWYPSARLFRQERRGDWAGVLQQVATALGEPFERQPGA